MEGSQDSTVRNARDEVPRARRVLIALLAALLAAVVLAPTLDEPFGTTITDLISARVGVFTENWSERGWWREEGRPLTTTLVGAPDTVAFYDHHPPLAYWLVAATSRIAGPGVFGLRFLPALASVLLVGVLAFVLARRMPAAVALLAAAGICATPLFVEHATIVHAESMLAVAFLLVALAAARRRVAVVAIATFVACWLDWPGYFVLPAIAVGELLRARGDRDRRVVVAAAAAAMLAALSTFALVAIWNGGVLLAWDNLVAAFRSGSGVVIGWGYWLRHAPLFGAELLTLPIVALLLIALPTSRKALQTRPFAHLLAVLLVPAVLHVLIFRGRSFHHGCWWLFFLAPAAVAFATVLAEVRVRWGRLAALLLAGGVIGHAALQSMRAVERLEDDRASTVAMRRLVDELAPPDALLISENQPSLLYGMGRPRADYTAAAWAAHGVVTRTLAVDAAVLLLEDSVTDADDLRRQLPAHDVTVITGGGRTAILFERREPLVAGSRERR